MKLFFFFFNNASYRGMLAVVISFHNCRGDQNHHGFNFKNYALSVWETMQKFAVVSKLEY